MRKIFLENNKIYHIYNRGVDKRIVFTEDDNYKRFIDYFFDFNDFKLLDISEDLGEENLRRETSENILENIDNKFLVDILAFCLMPNHFHLLLRQKSEGGIAKFMQRIGTGYTVAFNKKEERSGSLFQGTFKAVQVENQEYLDYLIFYIHFNPLSLMEKEKTNKKEIILDFLNNYRWSSHKDYFDVDKLPEDQLLINKEFILENFESSKEYKRKLFEWLDVIEERSNNKPFKLRAIDCE